MNQTGTSRLAAVLALIVASGTLSTAQQAQPYQPQLNQPGKDVQWVPTPPALVEKMLDLARLTPEGSAGRPRLRRRRPGDRGGAARRPRARHRVRPPPGRVLEAQARARPASTSGPRFVRGDIFETDFSDATVVTTFLLPSMNLRLRPTLPRHEAGHAHRREHVRDRRLAAGRDRRRSSRASAGARRCCGSCPRAWAARGARRKATWR